MKSFIIVGGNFQNTGAASMTLITADALRREYPDCRIVMFAPTRDVNKDNSNYTFEIVHMSERAMQHAQSGGIDFKYTAEGIVRALLGKGNLFKEYALLKELFSTCDGVFDINGYAISSQFRNQRTLSILNSVDLFAKHNIPYYFMPQSFGPFDYKENKELMLKRLKETLPKAKVIFTREHEGYLFLKDLIGEEKIVDSYDMVLQSSGINTENVYKQSPAVEKLEVNTIHNVAVVPNLRNFDHGDKEGILKLYKSAVEALLGLGKHIYLISHSAEDIEVCRQIKDMFASEDKVVLISSKIDTWNFETLIKQFEYVIASRFHSIVHSYRAGIPCIALGWATKYEELLNALGQGEYLFDVRKVNEPDGFVSAIMHMNDNWEKERSEIMTRLSKIQETNCFSQIDF